MAGLLSGLARLFGRGSGAKGYKVAEIYTGMREQAFTLGVSGAGLSQGQSSDQVRGVLMEAGLPEGVVTLLALAEGAVSIYFSNGGGTIGLGEHAGPAQVAREYLAMAKEFVPVCRPSSSHPLPDRGTIRFYVLTAEGVRTGQATESDLVERRSELWPLFYKGQELIEAIRVVDGKLNAEQPGRAAKGDTP